MRYWLLHGHWRVMMMIFRLLSATGAVWWLGLTGMKLFLAQMVGSSAMAVPQMRIRPRSTVDSAWPARIVLAGPYWRSTMANRTKQRGQDGSRVRSTSSAGSGEPLRILWPNYHLGCESCGPGSSWPSPYENLIVLPKNGMVNQAVDEFLESQERPE